MKESVGEDVWLELRESAVGVIIKLKEFSLYEFEDITGLNCDPFDTQEQWDLNELQALFPIIRNWPREKQLMVGLLCLLSIGIFGISSNSRIPLHCAKRVMDPAAFQRYPWGRVGFTSLVDSTKVLIYVGKRSYKLCGCVHALAIWIYESVPGLGEIYGHQIDGAEVPLLSWHGSRQRINFLNFCAQEKQQHQKVRVRHMILKPMEDRYPKWDEDEPPADLDNMIVDILNDQLNVKFWEVVPPSKYQKGKTHVSAPSVPDTVDESPSAKRKKEKQTAPEMAESHSDMPINNITIQKFLECVNNLNAKVETMDVSVAEKGKMMKKFLQMLATPKVQDDDDTCSNTMSLMVQTKKSSIDGLPIQRVVKKEKKNKKTMPVKEDVKPLKKVKTEKAFSIPELNDQSISTDDWENNLKWEKSVKCRQVLEALVSDVEPRRRRKQQLTKTQVWPFVGNPTVKRIITGVSKEPYDPLSKVDPDRKEKDESGFAYVST
ncbi:BnaA05g13280D [Brassica napus]|uniref:BnaA05g13280D protein n=1 Tax=Brassica napus TaxID=3708 RepID=A0A078F4G4_BRANA|nr:BnaA05g13280D [Brassica napus]